MNTKKQALAIKELNEEVVMVREEIMQINLRMENEKLSNEKFESLLKRANMLQKYVWEIKETIQMLESKN